MNLEQYEEMQKQLEEEQLQYRSQLIESLNAFHSSCNDGVFAQLSERPHLHYDIPDLNPQHCPQPSDAFKAVFEEFSEFESPRAASSKRDSEDLEADGLFAPNFAPNFGSFLASELLKSSSLPCSCVASFMDYLVQFSTSMICRCKDYKWEAFRRGLIFLRYDSVEEATNSGRQNHRTYGSIYQYVGNLNQKIIHFSDLSARTLAVCEHAGICVSEPTLQAFYEATKEDLKANPNPAIDAINSFEKTQAQLKFEENEWAQRVLSVSDAYINIEDIKSVLNEQDFQSSVIQTISEGLKHLGWICRREIVEEVIWECDKADFGRFGYLTNVDEMTARIRANEGLNSHDLKPPFREKAEYLKANLSSQNELDNLILEMIQEADVATNTQVKFEQQCSQILEEAIVQHQSFADRLPSFTQMGYRVTENSPANNVEVCTLEHMQPLFLSKIRTAEYINKMDCIPSKMRELDRFEDSVFHMNTRDAGGQQKTEDSSIDGQPPPSTFHWKMAVKDCDYSLSFIFGLLTASNTQNREHAAEAFLAEEIERNIRIMGKLGGEVSGRAQITKALHLTRFDKFSQLYGDLVVMTSEAMCHLLNIKISADELVNSTEATIEPSGNSSETSVDEKYRELDFPGMSQATGLFDSAFEFEETMAQVLQKDNASEHRFRVLNGDCVDDSGKRVVFTESITDVTTVLLEDQNALESYIERLCGVGRRKFIEHLAYEEEYLEIKYPSSSERQAYITSLSDAELFGFLGDERKALYEQHSSAQYIDTMQLVFDVLIEECALERSKTRITSLLSELSMFCSKEHVGVIENLAEEILIMRPSSLESYSSFKSPSEEEGRCFIDLTESSNIDRFVMDSMQVVRSPVEQIKKLAEALDMLAELINVAIELEYDTEHENQAEADFKVNGRSYFLNEQNDEYWTLIEMVFSLFHTCAEIQTIFTSECFPKVNEGLKEQSEGHESWYSYPLFTLELNEAIHHSVFEAAVAFLSRQICEFKHSGLSCFCLPENLDNLVDPGFLADSELLEELVEEVIGQIKREEPVASEKVFCSIAGLLAPEGGSCEKGEISCATEHFMLCLTLRDLYLKADKSSQIELQYLIGFCNFSIFNGSPPVLPLPFELYGKILNLRYAFGLMQRVLVQAHYLRWAEIQCLRATTECEIDESLILMYPRAPLQGVGYAYREIHGHECVTNNLPFLTTIDKDVYSMLLERFDLANVDFLVTALRSNDFALDGSLSAPPNAQELSVRDILLGANMDTAARFPLFKENVIGIIGIIARAAYLENGCNLVRTASLRSNEISVDFCITSEIVSNFRAETDGTPFLTLLDRPKYQFKYFDSEDFFKRADACTGPQERFSEELSSLYFNASEDILAGLAERAESDFEFKMRTYHEEELSSALIFAHSQQIVFTIGLAILAEIRRLGGISEVRGLLEVIRSQLVDISRDDVCLLVTASPIYRGQKESPSLMSDPFLLADDCSLAKVYQIPHPVAVNLFQSSTITINALIVMLTSFESTIRHSIMRTISNGENYRSNAGKLVTSELVFLHELAEIKLLDDDEIDMDVKPVDGDYVAAFRNQFASLSAEQVSRFRYSVRFDAVTCLTSGDIDFINNNIARTEQNLELLKQTQPGEFNELSELRQALEFSKTLLALKKSVELRDKNELLTFTGLVESYGVCVRKGLFEEARYLEIMLEKLSIRCTVPLLLHGAEATFSGQRIYELMQQYAFCRIFRTQLEQDPRQPQEEYELDKEQQNRPYAFETERRTIQNESTYAQLLLLEENREEQEDGAHLFKPLQEEVYMEPSLFSEYSAIKLVCAEHVSNEQLNKEGNLISLEDIEYFLIRLQIGVDGECLAYRNHGSHGCPMLAVGDTHEYATQPYYVDSSDLLQAMAHGVFYVSPFNGLLERDIVSGFGTDGTESIFAPFGVNGLYFKQQTETSLEPFLYDYSKSLEAAFCSSVTQTELEAIQQAKSQNSWEIIEETVRISAARLATDRLERLILVLHGIDQNSKDSILISELAILGQSSESLYEEAFKQKLDEMKEESQLHHSSYGETKLPAYKLQKEKEQLEFLETSLPLFLEERAIENVVDDACSSVIKENIEHIKLLFLNCTVLQVQASTLMNLSSYLNRRSAYISDCIRFSAGSSESLSSGDLEASFQKFMQPYAQQFNDLLILACRERGVQTSLKDMFEVLLSVIGLGSEPVDALERILMHQIPNEPTNEAGDPSLKQVVIKHPFLPQDVLCYALAVLHSGLQIFTIHVTAARLFRGIQTLIEAPERRLKDPRFDNMIENATEFRAGPYGDFFKFKILQVRFEDIISWLSEEDALNIPLELEEYHHCTFMRSIAAGIQQKRITSRVRVECAADSEMLIQEEKARAVALLDPLALPEMKLVQQLEGELYAAFEEYIATENRLRSDLHDQCTERLIDCNANLIRTNYALRRVELLANFFEADALQERNETSRQLAARLYEIAGIEIEGEPETMRLAEFEEDESRESVVENYQRSIAECTRALQNLEVKILIFQNLSNYRQSILMRRLENEKISTENGIVNAFAVLYSDVIKSAQLDDELLSELARVTSLIAVKQSEIEKTKRITQENASQHRPRTTNSALNPQEAQVTVEESLQEQMATKMLPELENSVIEKSMRACSEGEAMLVKYKHLSEEGKQLEEQLEQMTDALRIMHEKQAVDKEVHQQAIKKERHIIRQQEEQSDMLQREIDQLKVLSGEILQQEEEKLKLSGDAMAVKLRSEIDAVERSRQLWREKNEELRATYEELFKLLQ